MSERLWRQQCEVQRLEAQVEQLQRDVAAAKQRENEKRERGREYFDAKRELSNTTRIRDTILFRVMQEDVGVDCLVSLYDLV